jgi:cation diffusion facilitator family transporter
MTGSPSEIPVAHHEAAREKRNAALSSVFAAVALTAMKTAVGALTGSLGILAEAAHSGLDLVAAGVTLLAVRVSGRPADREHSYGHGKVENLSALFETLLLLVTCVWICYEAMQRLFVKQVHVESSMWAFVVMAVSIAVDFSRSRMLQRVARKHKSQALEADALHFSTDIWSSSVVIVGLLLVRLADLTGWRALAQADALAALGVCVVVVYVSVELGRRSIQALLDGVPGKLHDEVMRAVKVPGVIDVRQVRVRASGAEVFADVVLTVDRSTSFDESHAVASLAEAEVQALLPGADVLVHVEPTGGEDGTSTPALIRAIAARHGISAHAIRIHDVLGRQTLETHLEIGEPIDVAGAHARATAFEEDLRRALPMLSQIVTHIEPAVDEDAAEPAVGDVQGVELRRAVETLAERLAIPCRPHEMQMRTVGGRPALSFHCTMDGAEPLKEAHRVTEELERALRERFPSLSSVTIHIEPPEADDPAIPS